MKYLFLIFTSSIAFTGFSKSFDPIVIGLDIGKQNHFSEFNSLSTPFSALNKDVSDSDLLKQRRHGIYIEPWVFGSALTFGYSYDFFKRNRFSLTASIGTGGVLRFTNPNGAFFIPIGVESKFQLKKRFHITGGIYNFYYINYWAHFSNEGKDCLGLWTCPPDTDPFILMPFIGGSLEYDRISYELKTYFSFFAWWNNKVYPIPALRIKLKL